MDDTETTTVTTAETTETTPPVYFGNDGSLVKGWQGTLDEGYRDEASLNGVNDTKVLAKMFVDTKRMVGKNRIATPTDASTEAEWEEYHKAGGRPETAADYGLKAPEGMDAETAERVLPKAELEKWQERFFKTGINQKGANKLVEDFVQDVLATENAQKQLEKQEMDKLVADLANDWGAAFEQNKHFCDVAVEEGTNGDIDFKLRLTDKFGNDPDFIRLVSNLGKKFAEGRSPDFTAVPTPSDLQTQIAELEANPLYLNGTVKQRMDIANRIMELRKKMPAKTT